jgi:ketol-acid reductoisomerase
LQPLERAITPVKPDKTQKEKNMSVAAFGNHSAVTVPRQDRDSYETLVEAGYQPEMAYFECLHELKLIVDLMYESGIAGMRFSCSERAKWGDVSVGPKVVDESVKKRMKQILNEIQNREFAKGWIGEYKNGLPTYKELLEQGEKHPIEEVGVRLRSLMPWVQKKNIKGAQAAY